MEYRVKTRKCNEPEQKLENTLRYTEPTEKTSLGFNENNAQ